MGYLRDLRHSWRVRTGYFLNNEGLLTATSFIGQYGLTARFHHVGLDSYPKSIGHSRSYGAQLFALFSGERHQKAVIPFTARDLQELAETLQRLPAGYTKRAAIITHLQREIGIAAANLEAHQATFHRLNPEAAKLTAQLN